MERTVCTTASWRHRDPRAAAYDKSAMTYAGSRWRAADILERTSMTDLSNVTRPTKAGEKCRKMPYRQILVGFALAALLSVAGCTASVQLGPQTVAGLAPSGTVNMDQVQVAYLASAGGGTGTLYYQGVAYPFS